MSDPSSTAARYRELAAAAKRLVEAAADPAMPATMGADYWAGRARQAQLEAAAMIDPEARRQMEIVVQTYLELAKLAATREAAKGGRGDPE